jgi:hypothetical protein
VLLNPPFVSITFFIGHPVTIGVLVREAVDAGLSEIKFNRMAGA